MAQVPDASRTSSVLPGGGEFDPTGFARLRFGELKDMLHQTNSAAGSPSVSAMNSALVLQAGFRALTDVAGRTDMVAVQGRDSDPDLVKNTQNLAHKIFSGDRVADPEEKSQIVTAMRTAAADLARQGYDKFICPISGWLAAQGATQPAGARNRPSSDLVP